MQKPSVQQMSNAWVGYAVVGLLVTCVLLGVRAANRIAAPILPNHKLTPGVVLPVTTAQICVPGYAGDTRNVSQATKMQVFKEYHLVPTPHEFEVDHLISLELGGSNAIGNLWPQSYLTHPWNAHVKDKLEDHLHSVVCKGDVPLTTAQHALRTNWIDAYKKYVGGTP